MADQTHRRKIVDKSIVEIPVLSDAVRRFGIPLSICVRAGGLLFVSGLPPLDLKTGSVIRGDIEAQTVQVMENIKYTLETAGSSLDRVVKCQVFVTNAAYYRIVNEIYGRYFTHDPPARTFVAMASWPMELDIEIECIALA